MHNESASFIQADIKLNPDTSTKTPEREFIFEDHCGNGKFLLKDIRIELFRDGKWKFYLSAEGRRATTVLKNGRNCGPELFIVFKNITGDVIKETSVGQVNYSCKDDEVYTYISKGVVEEPLSIRDIEVRYDAFLDFTCGKMKIEN